MPLSLIVSGNRETSTIYNSCHGPILCLLLEIAGYMLHPFRPCLRVLPVRAPGHVLGPVMVPLALVPLSPLIESVPVPTRVLHAHVGQVLLIHFMK